jgi:hypothetical protein
MIAFVAFPCKSGQSQLKSDLESANLKGRIWKIERTISDTKNKCACAIKDESNKSKYVYDMSGNLIVSYFIDENGKIGDSTVYAYDRRGLCSQITRFNGKKPEGKDLPIIENGKLTGYKTFNENGGLIASSRYVYTGDGITEEKTLNGNGEVVGTVQKELLKGQLVSQSEKDAKGLLLTVTRFKRNSNNDVIEYLVSVSKDNKDFKFTYEYEYDNAGNWTKQTRFYNGQIESIVVRNIEYYKI